MAVHDTLREVNTVTVMLREPQDGQAAPDTVFRSVVNDRERVRDRVAATAVREKVEVRVDTVYLERRDSVYVSQTSQKAQTGGAAVWVSGLKWVFWIIVAIGGLVLVVRFGKKGILW